VAASIVLPCFFFPGGEDLETCLFCNRNGRYNRNPGTEYICGRCVQLLLDAGQDDLKRAYALAIEKGIDRKAKAMESFLIPEEHNEQRKPKSKFRLNINRKRSFRSVRDKKERIRLATA
jgi:hypothetical protein